MHTPPKQHEVKIFITMERQFINLQAFPGGREEALLLFALLNDSKASVKNFEVTI